MNIYLQSAEDRDPLLAKKLNVAILGGSFDPITKGHIQLAHYVLKNSDIQEVWITPCFHHMFGKNMSSSTHRLEMCKIATNQFPNIKVFDFEIENNLCNGTYDFLSNLMKDIRYSKKYKFSYIIGMDNANNFLKWKNAQMLKDMVRFIVVSRQGINPDKDPDQEAHWYKEEPHLLLQAGLDIMDISSTFIRGSIKNDNANINSLNNYTIRDVSNYIKDHNLYEKNTEI